MWAPSELALSVAVGFCGVAFSTLSSLSFSMDAWQRIPPTKFVYQNSLGGAAEALDSTILHYLTRRIRRSDVWKSIFQGVRWGGGASGVGLSEVRWGGVARGLVGTTPERTPQG